MRAVERWFRVFLVGGVIAYRGLFNWIRPEIYIPTMLGSPLFQIVFFAKLGQYAGAEDTSFYVVGNAVQVCAMASVYGMTMAIANERWFGTLGPLLATPANRAAVFLGRGIPVLANGLIVSAFGFGVGVAVLGFRPGWATVPSLAAVVVATACSCTAFGMLLGSIGLRAKDFWFAANLTYFLMLLLCGVNVPLDVLPGWMSAISRCLPLTHGIMAAREVADGASLGSVGGLVWTELGIGACYATAAYALFRVLERESRRAAVLDSY
jgi:ABC-2 type transport system permease protein